MTGGLVGVGCCFETVLGPCRVYSTCIVYGLLMSLPMSWRRKWMTGQQLVGPADLKPF
jgi:hypothetical protein